MSAPDQPTLFRHPDFARLWASNLLGDLGAAFATLAMSVTAVAVLHASSFEVAAIAAIRNGAYLVLGVPVGVWADRVPPKLLLVTADLARCVAVATVPLAFALHALTIAQLMGVAAVTSAANVSYEVAHTTALPGVVGRGRVAEASARLQSADSTVQVIGPGLAGQLVALTAGPVAYLATAVLHLASSVSAGLIGARRPGERSVDPPAEPPAEPPAARPPFWASLAEGLGYVVRSPLQRTFMLAAATVNFGAGFIAAAFPLFVLRTLRFSPGEYGLVLSVGAVGGIVASLIGMRVRARLGEIRTPIVCYALIPLAFAPSPLAPQLPLPAPVSVATAEFLLSLVIVTAGISSSGVFARITPPAMFGRVTAARRTVTMGVLPLGALLGGLLAGAIGYASTLWVGAGLIACSVAVFASSPIIRMRELPPDREDAPAA